jgi:endogenous inhibitor of DNA gyrase (YacG/DUF329 family)
MKGWTILLDHIDGREAAAMLAEGRLDDLLIDDAGSPRPGAIFRAICDRPLKGQGGMMLRLPDGETAFLRAGKGLRPGQPLLFKSRYAIVTPGAPGINVSRAISEDDERDRLLGVAAGVETGDFGLILRSSCLGAGADDIADDIAAMADLATAVLADALGADPEALTEGDGPHGVAWREWTGRADVVTDPGCFAAHGVLDQIAGLGDPKVELGEGTMYGAVRTATQTRTAAFGPHDQGVGPVTCPICKRPTLADYRPFCSKRCADVDLGKWLTGSYAIPANDPDEADEVEREIAKVPEKPH